MWNQNIETGEKEERVYWTCEECGGKASCPVSVVKEECPFVLESKICICNNCHYFECCKGIIRMEE